MWIRISARRSKTTVSVMNIEIGVITDEITIAMDEALHLYSKILKFDAPASRIVKGIQD